VHHISPHAHGLVLSHLGVIGKSVPVARKDRRDARAWGGVVSYRGFLSQHTPLTPDRRPPSNSTGGVLIDTLDLAI
jgi:hypothetical protein